MLQASYTFLIVDEYQDCVVEQHHLVVALSASLPVCVFGDRLQNIFNFGNNVTVSWTSDVVATWPAFAVPCQPWRWKGHNEALGRWLLYIRTNLTEGRPIDLEVAPAAWWRATSPHARVQACLAKASVAGSVVAIAQFPPTCQIVFVRSRRVHGVRCLA